jgi:regulator of sigma E protease
MLPTRLMAAGKPRLQVSANASGQALPSSHASRTLTLPVSRIPATDVDASLLDRIGLTGPYVEPIIAQVLAGGPAERAGLRAGDRVLQINGQVPADATQLRQLIGASHDQGQAKSIQLQVQRAGQALDVTVTPVMKDIDGKQLARVEAGIGAPAMVEVRYGPLEGLNLALERTWDISRMSLSMLGKMVTGQASLKNLSGPLTIADYAGRSADLGWVHYLGFLGLVSVSLGVLNLLPLPVLDGGHLMYYLFEGLTGRPISEVWLERLQRGGVAIMLTMMSLALYNDLARLLGSH